MYRVVRALATGDQCVERGGKAPPSQRSCEETSWISVLPNEKTALSSRHEPRKCDRQTAVDPLREPAADELAGGGCGGTHWRGPSGADHLDAGGALGPEFVLSSDRKQRGSAGALSPPRPRGGVLSRVDQN